MVSPVSWLYGAGLSGLLNEKIIACSSWGDDADRGRSSHVLTACFSWLRAPLTRALGDFCLFEGAVQVLILQEFCPGSA